MKSDSKGVISKIKVNPYFGTYEYLKIYDRVYDVYNPDQKAVFEQQARDTKDGKCFYPGQILYVATTGPLSRFYPAPKYYSCHYWMAVDEAIGGFHKHNIDNGFFQSVMLRLIGDPNVPSTHPDDMTWNATTNQYEPNPKNTAGMRLNKEMQKFSGWTKAGNVMAQWGLNKEEWPDLVAMPATSNAELFKTIQDITTEQIARATKVPSILANIQSGATLGGDGNAIRASVKLMQQRTVKTHGMLERVYKDLLSRMDQPYMGEVKILHYNPFPEMEKIDSLIWAAIPLEDQRAWIVKNTEFTITAQPTATATPTQPQPVNKFMGVSYTSYPDGAKTTAKKALDFKTKMHSNCGSKKGWEICQDIIDGKPIAYPMVRRIKNYLIKNEQFSNNTFSDSCESLLFSCWGGKDMLKWTQLIISTINE